MIPLPDTSEIAALATQMQGHHIQRVAYSYLSGASNENPEPVYSAATNPHHTISGAVHLMLDSGLSVEIGSNGEPLLDRAAFDTSLTPCPRDICRHLSCRLWVREVGRTIS